jgi:hypothetical protein
MSSREDTKKRGRLCSDRRDVLCRVCVPRFVLCVCVRVCGRDVWFCGLVVFHRKLGFLLARFSFK